MVHKEWGTARHDSADRTSLILVPRAVASAERKDEDEAKVEVEINGMEGCVKASVCAFGCCSINACVEGRLEANETFWAKKPKNCSPDKNLVPKLEIARERWIGRFSGWRGMHNLWLHAKKK